MTRIPLDQWLADHGGGTAVAEPPTGSVRLEDFLAAHGGEAAPSEPPTADELFGAAPGDAEPSDGLEPMAELARSLAAWGADDVRNEATRQKIAADEQAWLADNENWGPLDWIRYRSSLPIPITADVAASPELADKYARANELITGEPLIGSARTPSQIATERARMLNAGVDDPLAWLQQQEAASDPNANIVSRTAGAAVSGLVEGVDQTFDSLLGRSNEIRTAGLEQGWREGVEQLKDADSWLGEFAAGAVRKTGETVGRMVPALAAGAATKNPVAAYGILGGQAGVDEFGRKRAEGWSWPAAALYGAASGAVETATEAAGGKLASGLGLATAEEVLSGPLGKAGRSLFAGVKSPTLRRTAEALAGSVMEGGEELLADVLHEVKNTMAGAASQAGDPLETFVVGMLAGGSLHGVRSFAEFLANATPRRARAAGIPPKVAPRQQDLDRLAEKARQVATEAQAPAEVPQGTPTEPVDASVPPVAQEPQVVAEGVPGATGEAVLPPEAVADGTSPQEIDLTGIGVAVADNLYEAMQTSLESTGEMPSTERQANTLANQLWEQSKPLGIPPEVFISTLRAAQPQTPADYKAVLDTFRGMAQQTDGAVPPSVAPLTPPAPDVSAPAGVGVEPNVAEATPVVPLDKKKAAKARREYARMRKQETVATETLDEIANLPEPQQVELYGKAEFYADAENEYLRGVIDDYNNVIGGGITSGRARLIERRGGDAAKLPGFDLAVERLRSGDYPNLANEAAARGGGDIEAGLFEIVQGGKAALERELKQPDSWLAEILEQSRGTRSTAETDAGGDRGYPADWDAIEGGGEASGAEADEAQGPAEADDFRLENAQPTPAPQSFENAAGAQQTFITGRGRDLAGQETLFDPDGTANDELRGTSAAASLPAFTSLGSQPATTPRGKRLLATLQKDAARTGPKRVGLRTINEYLADLAQTVLMVGKSQTSRRNPAHYLGKVNRAGRPTGKGPHIIRSRNAYSHVNVHEVGHAVSALLADADPRWHKSMSENLIPLTMLPDSAASAKNSEEGWAELVRRYVVLPGSLPGKLSQALEATLGKHAPEVLDGLQDAQRAYAFHRSRPALDQLQSVMQDRGSDKSKVGQFKDAVYRAMFAAIGGNVVLHRLYRRASFGIGGDSLVNRYDPTGLTGVARAQYDQLYREQRHAARKFFDEIKDTPADAQSAYQSMLHVPGEISRAFWGSQRGQEGVRVRATGEGLGALSEGELKTLKTAGFKLPTAASRHGNWINLSDKSFDSIRRKVGEDNWDAFETWGQYKAALNRYEKAGHEYPLMRDGLTPETLRQFVDQHAEANPEWNERFREINEYMDQLLLLPVLSGEVTADEAANIKLAWEDYWPLPRQIEGRATTGRQGGAGVEPSSGIRAAFGSELPFKSLSEAVETRTRMALQAYYGNRLMLAVKNYGLELSKQDAAPFDVRKDGARLMLPLKMDIAPAAKLTVPEQQQIAADAINDMTAAELGVPRDRLPPESLVAPEDVLISTPSRPVWRSRKPNVAHVAKVFEQGAAQYYQIPDPLLFDLFASTRATPNAYARWFGKLFRGLSNPWKRGITQNLLFAMRNALSRDPFTAVTLSDDQAKRTLVPGYLTASAVVNRLTGGNIDALAESELLSRSLDATTSKPHQTLANDFWDMLTEGIAVPDYRDMAWYDKIAIAPGQAMSALLKPVDVFNYATMGRWAARTSESLTREGAYLEAARGGLSEERAQMAYDEITGNFGQRGGNPEMAEVIRSAGFLNPALQILWGQSMKMTHPDPQARAYLLAAKLPAIGATMAIGSAINVLLVSLTHDEDDAQEIFAKMKERLERDRLMSMSVGGKLRIPFDYGMVGAMQSYAWNTVEEKLIESPVDAGKKAKALLARVGQLPGLEDTLPPHMKLWFELGAGPTGHSFFFDDDIVPGWLVDKYPENPELQTTPDTPSFYKFVGGALGVSPLKARYAVQNGLSRELDSFVTALERPEQTVSDFPVVGRLVQRDPGGHYSQSVRSLMDLDADYKMAKQQAGAETDPARKAQLESQTAALDAAHSAATLMDKLWSLAKERRKGGDMPGYREVKKIMVGLGRDALGEKPERAYPGPWSAWSDMPDDVKSEVNRYLGSKARTAVLAHGTPEQQDDETDAEFAERTADFEQRKAAALTWLQAHKSSPAVQAALEEVQRSKSYRAMTEGVYVTPSGQVKYRTIKPAGRAAKRTLAELRAE